MALVFLKSLRVSMFWLASMWGKRWEKNKECTTKKKKKKKNGHTNTRCITTVCFSKVTSDLTVFIFPAVKLKLLGTASSCDWLALRSTYPWRTAGVIPRQLSRTRHPARSKPLNPMIFHISPPLWILIWKFSINFCAPPPLSLLVFVHPRFITLSSLNLTPLSFPPPRSFRT